MSLRSRVGWILLCSVLTMTVSAGALRWSPNELDVVQAPGTTQSYRLLLKNEEPEPTQVRIFVADWFRDAQGRNDLSLPLHGARWQFERSFAEGERIEIRYAVVLPDGGDVGVAGGFRTWKPQITGEISGVQRISAQAVGDTPAVVGGQVAVDRRVEDVTLAGRASIALTIRCSVAFEGLTIEEAYSRGVSIEDVDSAGARFDTVNRSSADWVEVSAEEVTLDPEESREIELTIRTPDAYDGTYWCIVHAESRELKVLGEISGTQIVSRPSVGLKVLSTAPGTESLSAVVRSVSVAAIDPLTLEARLENTGNVQLVVTAEAEVIDQSGNRIAEIGFSEFGRDYFRILPGSTRTVEIVGFGSEAPLEPGIYQAIVSFDYGGDRLVVGVKGFRVR